MSQCSTARPSKRSSHDLRVLPQHARASSRNDTASPRPREARSQQITQLREHAIGARGVRLHERRNRIQRIEEEVRTQLRLQLCELRFGERLLHARACARDVLAPFAEREQAEHQPEPQAVEQGTP